MAHEKTGKHSSCTEEKKQSIETVIEEIHILDLLHKDFKISVCVCIYIITYSEAKGSHI